MQPCARSGYFAWAGFQHSLTMNKNSLRRKIIRILSNLEMEFKEQMEEFNELLDHYREEMEFDEEAELDQSKEEAVCKLDSAFSEATFAIDDIDNAFIDMFYLNNHIKNNEQKQNRLKRLLLRTILDAELDYSEKLDVIYEAVDRYEAEMERTASQNEMKEWNKGREKMNDAILKLDNEFDEMNFALDDMFEEYDSDHCSSSSSTRYASRYEDDDDYEDDDYDNEDDDDEDEDEDEDDGELTEEELVELEKEAIAEADKILRRERKHGASSKPAAFPSFLRPPTTAEKPVWEEPIVRDIIDNDYTFLRGNSRLEERLKSDTGLQNRIRNILKDSYMSDWVKKQYIHDILKDYSGRKGNLDPDLIRADPSLDDPDAYDLDDKEIDF